MKPGSALMKTAQRGVVLSLFAFIVLPMLLIGFISLTSGDTLTFPLPGLSLRWYAELLRNAGYISSLKISTIIALSSAMIASLLGVSLAYALNKYEIKFKPLWYGLIITPLILPPVALAVAFLNLFVPLGLLEKPLGVIIAHSVFILAFPFLLALAGLRELGPEVQEAAMNLGANELKTFTTVTFPLIKSNIAAGFIFAFVMSFNEFIIAYLLAGYTAVTVPIRIFSSLRYAFDPLVASISVVVIIFTALITIIITKISRGGIW